MKKITLMFIISLMISNMLISQEEITSKEIYKHIEFLASDSLKGRFPGTPETKVAANYILNDFEKSGLKPMFDNGFQSFEINIGKKIVKTSLKIDEFLCKYVEEYNILGFSPSGNFTGKTVFVGWGFNINTGKYSWNDYDGVDVKGKWVVLFRGKPVIDGYPKTLFDAGASEYEKVLEAEDHGAVGVIFVNSYQKNNNDELIKPCYGRVALKSTIPAYSVKRFTANRLFKSIGKDVKTVENDIAKGREPNSFDLKTTISAILKVDLVKIKTQNVVAVIEGSDKKLKNEYIVIGAHYDHLGFGGCGSGSRMPDTIAIHNGADDNASGDAGIMELAEYLSAHKKELKRSIIFVAFGAEERGLLGSKYFVDNLPVSKENIYAMLNLDMVGKSVGKLNMMGEGTATEFENILGKIENDKSKFEIKHHQKVYSSSDHASFYNAGIPVLFFFASSFVGYHTPFDDIEEINSEGEADVLKYIAKVALELSTNNGDLSFVKVRSESSHNHSYGMKVKLGIIPSFDDTDDKGFKISGVTTDGPAEYAGMKENDIIISINKEIVNNIYDYMARMKKVNPGDIILIEILRDNKKLKFNVQL